MTTVSAAISFVAGAVLALITLMGGVAAITPDANSAAKSDTVVFYDAP
ncbi:MAG: hypothetical protein L0G89_01055 [Janibacter sp.]|nr:hypothetical protein [Janibacter sp.]